MAELTTMRPGSTPTPAVDTKILGDLNTLVEKMDLCDSMLHPGAGDAKLSVKSSEAMLAVVGFLEACAPRMVELVEAAAQGALSEDVFAQCLSVNDRLQKILADVETAAMTETTASTTTASAPAKTDDNVTEELTDGFKDLLFGDDQDMFSSKQAAAPSNGGGGKSTGEDDDIFSSKKPAPVPMGGAKTTGEEDDNNEAKPAAASIPATDAAVGGVGDAAGGGLNQTPSNDEFDDFFNERTTNNF